MSDNKLVQNLEKLSRIAEFQKDWNGYNAEPIPKEVISYTRKILSCLEEQPDLFPTTIQSIQLEYEDEREKYLEIEIFVDRVVIMQVLREDYDNAKFWDFHCDDIEQITQVVNEFLQQENE